MPKSLMAGGTTASFELHRGSITDELQGDGIAVLHPGKSCIGYVFILADNMKDLRPKPLGRVNPPFVFGVILPTPSGGQLVDFRSFLDSRMVFPQYQHRIGVFFKSRLESQWLSISIYRYGRRPGSVHTNARHLVRADP